MSWYEKNKANQSVKKLKRLAKKFNLGETLETEVSEVVTELVREMLENGVASCLESPGEDLSTDEGQMLFLSTSEFKSINRISDDRLPDNLTIELFPRLKFSPNRRDAYANAFFASGKDQVNFIILAMEFGPNDLMSPREFMGEMADRMSLMAQHEVLHYLRQVGGLESETNKANYIKPEDDGSNYMEYISQNVELENQLSDLHNYMNTDLQTLVNNLPHALSLIYAFHNMPNTRLKRGIMSRIYKTIHEMDSSHIDEMEQSHSTDMFQAIFQNGKEALLLALRKDDNAINQRLDKIRDIIHTR